jgi:hypothetical protein
MPVAALVATVAPVNAQVKRVTEQLSAVTGLVVTTGAEQVPAKTFALTFDGHDIVGLILSRTVTVIEHVLLFPVLSTAVQTIVVVPIGNVPEALPVPFKSFVIEAMPSLSVAIATGTVTAALHCPASTF